MRCCDECCISKLYYNGNYFFFIYLEGAVTLWWMFLYFCLYLHCVPGIWICVYKILIKNFCHNVDWNVCYWLKKVQKIICYMFNIHMYFFMLIHEENLPFGPQEPWHKRSCWTGPRHGLPEFIGAGFWQCRRRWTSARSPHLALHPLHSLHVVHSPSTVTT